MIRLLTAALSVVLAASVSPPRSVGIYRHDVDPVRFEDLAARAEFAPTGRVSVTSADGRSSRPAGSITLVSPRWAITAAHVVGAPVERIAVEFRITTFGVDSIVFHPKHVEGAYPFTGDLALVRLRRPTAVPAAVLDQKVPSTGWTGVQVGYGDLTSGSDKGVGKAIRHAGTNDIDLAYVGQVSGKALSLPVFGADFDAPGDPSASTLGDSGPSALEIAVSGGDSGGGLYRDEGREWFLAGVTFSRDMSHVVRRLRSGAVGRYGIVSYYAAVEPQLDWICRIINYENAGCPSPHSPD